MTGDHLTPFNGKTAGSTSNPMPRRFYRTAAVEPTPATSDPAASGETYRIVLDGRPLRTPATKELSVPSRVLAEAVAAEWQSQRDHIDPTTMPLTRLINTALDGVAGREAEIRRNLVQFAASDLLCYYAEAPATLAERQREGWTPVLDWAHEQLGISFKLTAGVMPIAQDPETLRRVEMMLSEHNALTLAAHHEIATLTGSIVLSLACTHGRLSPHQVWTLAHIDEDYQIEQWGVDREAADRRERRWQDLQAAARVLQLITPTLGTTRSA